jgi:hypothetical protein
VRTGRRILTCLFLTLAGVAIGRAQAPITAISLGTNQIGLVKTAQGLSTRISFPEPVREIICGDLYDATSGRGSFVVQRGDSDVFVKPIPSKGISNLFVKTGVSGEHVYNFDLVIVSPSEALRVVNVVGQAGDSGRDGGPKAADVEQNARQQAADILRQAQTQADDIVGRAKEEAEAATRDAADRAQKDIDRKFVNALMLGLRQSKAADSKAVSHGAVVITLDQHIVTFGDKSYLRYTIHNNGPKDFTFSSMAMEKGPNQAVSSEVLQSTPENSIKPGQSLSGIVVFDPKSIDSKDHVTLFLRGEGSSELARVAVSQ